MRIVEMARNDIKNSSLLKTKFLIYAFNGRTLFSLEWDGKESVFCKVSRNLLSFDFVSS